MISDVIVSVLEIVLVNSSVVIGVGVSVTVELIEAMDIDEVVVDISSPVLGTTDVY